MNNILENKILEEIFLKFKDKNSILLDIEKQINYKINLFEEEKTKTIHINQIKREIIQKSLKI